MPGKKAAKKKAAKKAPKKKAVKKKAVKKAPKKKAPKKAPKKKAVKKAVKKQVKKPAARKPTAKKPVARKPAAKKAAARKPAAKVAKKPTGQPVRKPAARPVKMTPAAQRPAETDAFTISTTPKKKGQVGGRLEMSSKVVAAIANFTARRVEGIHALGKAGLLYSSIGADPTRGVDAEVGDRQAALDLEVVIEYGCDINDTAAELRRQIAEEVYKTAGREVVEINIKVTGIHIEE